jgi:hypothetical protein
MMMMMVVVICAGRQIDRKHGHLDEQPDTTSVKESSFMATECRQEK